VLWEKKEGLHIKRCMGNNIMKAIKNKFNSMPFKSINFSQTPTHQTLGLNTIKAYRYEGRRNNFPI
jgi:hypothetical protein